MSRPTRKQIAKELLRMLETGPSLGFCGRPMTPNEAEEDVRRWIRSWILPRVKKLVPELKPKPPTTEATP